MTQEIKDINKNIAKYMGVRYTNSLTYHSDWNELMKVVKKLMDRCMGSYDHQTKMAYNDISSNLYLVDIELIHKKVDVLINRFKSD